MAEPYKPGARYQPTSGTEGEGFMECWCDECERDRGMREDTGPGCPILARALALDVMDPDYPDEWTYNAEGRPICTAFVPEGGNAPTDRELEARGQATLFTAEASHA